MPAAGPQPLWTHLPDTRPQRLCHTPSESSSEAIGGDVVAAAYREYAGVVFGVARGVVLHSELAEEVTQEVFLCLWRTPEGFDVAKGSMRTFLCTLAHRRAVDVVRREESRRCRERCASDDSHRIIGFHAPDHAHFVVERECHEEIRRAVACLAPSEREAIELAYYEGRTYREVSVILGIPEGTAKGRIRMALRRLSVVLDSVGVQGLAQAG